MTANKPIVFNALFMFFFLCGLFCIYRCFTCATLFHFAVLVFFFKFQKFFCCFTAVLVVFDLQSLESLIHAEKWKNDACKEMEIQNPYVFLIGTKRDLVVRII